MKEQKKSKEGVGVRNIIIKFAGMGGGLTWQPLYLMVVVHFIYPSLHLVQSPFDWYPAS